MSAADDDVAMLVNAVKAYVDPALDALHQRIDELPRSERGEKGDAGESGDAGPAGRDGTDGKDGRSVTSSAISQDGELMLTMSDGSLQSAGLVVGQRGTRGADGRDGVDGKDGFGFDDLAVEHDGERTITLRFCRGDEVKEFPFRFPVQIYRGVFREGVTYQHGDTVTFGGSTWHCNADTCEKPGEGSAVWTLSVKRGRAGRSAAK